MKKIENREYRKMNFRLCDIKKRLAEDENENKKATEEETAPTEEDSESEEPSKENEEEEKEEPKEETEETTEETTEEPKEEKSYKVRGYATTFNEPYTLMSFDDTEIREQVDPHAFDECDTSDVIFQLNHEGRVYARTRNNTLTLKTDEHGLSVEADLSGTEEGRKLFDEIRGGYLDRMSFGFTVNEDDTKEEKENGKTVFVRTIKKIGKLYDVSAVSIPANDMTDISARSFCDGVIAKVEAERLREKTEIEERNRESEERERRLKLLEFENFLRCCQ